MSQLNGYVKGLIARQSSSSGLQSITLSDFPEPGKNTVVAIKAMTLSDRRFIDNATNQHSSSPMLTSSRLAINALVQVVRCARVAQSGALLFVDEYDTQGNKVAEASIDAAMHEVIKQIIDTWTGDPDEWLRWGTDVLRALNPQSEPAPELDEPVEVPDPAAEQAALQHLDNTLAAIEKKS